MAYNGNGLFTLPAGNPFVTGTVISSSVMNTTMSQIAAGLSTAICKDGQQTVTANIPMAGFKLTGLGAATTTGDALAQGMAASVTTLAASGNVTISPAQLTVQGAAVLTANTIISTMKGSSSASDRGIVVRTDINSDIYIAAIRASDGTEGFTLQLNRNSGDVQMGAGTFIVPSTSSGGGNVAATAARLGKDTGTNRSINAAGTINASGADFAEYMRKAVASMVFAKGGICGVNSDGFLTDVYADAISFVVKSTSPTIVGGDVWASPEIVGEKPIEPRLSLPPQPEKADQKSTATWKAVCTEICATHEAAKAAYGETLKAWQDAVERARQMVDRIAFAGLTPVNVTLFNVGDFIIPQDDGTGRIVGVAIPSPTFEQYRSAVGKVIAKEPDGRARIIVKVS